MAARLDRLTEQIKKWLAANPGGTYNQFMKETALKVAMWHFYRVRRKVNVSGGISKVRTSSARRVYTTVISMSAEDLAKKSGKDLLQELMDKFNVTFKMHLEMSTVRIYGSETETIEIRRYNR